MIRMLHWPEDGSRPVPVSPTEVTELPTSGWTWVDLVAEEEATIRLQAEKLGIDPALALRSMQPTRAPDLEEGAGYLHVVLNGFVSGQGERLFTTDLDVFAGGSYVLTIHDGNLPVLEWSFDQLSSGALAIQASPAGLLGHLALVASRRLAPLLTQLEDQIDSLEELALVADPRAVTEVHALRRDIILLRRTLRPQFQVYEELAISEHPLIDDRDRLLFRRVAASQAHSLESLEAAMHLLSSLLETHRSATADQTNEIVRVLTVFSAVMLPLGLLAGIMGMNFEQIPAATQPWGFWVAIGLMFVIAAGLWVYFVRRGFVGAPRLRELPRSVGLGLIQVGTAPIRAVTGGLESTIRFVSGGEPGQGSATE